MLSRARAAAGKGGLTRLCVTGCVFTGASAQVNYEVAKVGLALEPRALPKAVDQRQRLTSAKAYEVHRCVLHTRL